MLALWCLVGCCQPGSKPGPGGAHSNLRAGQPHSLTPATPQSRRERTADCVPVVRLRCTLRLWLQIARAAITTSNGGAVYDVFEIVAEPSGGHEPVSAGDVQFHVHQALYKWKSANPGAAAAADQAAGIAIGKRQRM